MKGWTRRRQTIAWAGVAAAVLLAVVSMVAAARRNSPSSSTGDIPTGLVKRGNLDLRVHATAELHASHSTMLTAPPIGGGNLKITRLLHTGTPVRKGEVVVEFDPSEQRYNLEQSRSELLQAEQEIIKAQADAAVQAAKDKVAILKARFDVRLAVLDVQKNELESAISARKNQLALEEANRAQDQLQQDIKSHTVSGQAGISLAQEKRHKAKMAMDQAQQNIEMMRVTSPMDGLVSLEKNTGSRFFFFDGMNLPEYREGDQVEAGSGVAQVIEPTEMELVAKVGELDRNNVAIGQPVEIELDALAGHIFHGTVKSVGGMSSHQFFWENSSGSKFEVSIQITGADSRLHPGFTAHVSIVGDQQKNVLYVPRQALFLKDGRRVVYARDGAGFDAREVKIRSQNESRAAIEGLAEGTEVALADPASPTKSAGVGQAALVGGP